MNRKYPKPNIGDKRHQLTIVSVPNDGTVICKCDCGTFTRIKITYFSIGRTQSCGCLQRKAAANNGRGGAHKLRRYFVKLGQRFGRLTVIDPEVRVPGQMGFFARCKCDCGNTNIVPLPHLSNGHSQSCGCRLKEIISGPKPWRRKYKTPEAKYFYHLKNYCVKINREFSMSLENFSLLVKKNCIYCDKSPSVQGHGIYLLNKNGIDRLNNQFGYTEENSVPCCTTCNRAKNSHSLKEWFNWIKQLYSIHFDMDGNLNPRAVELIQKSDSIN
jgi:hypothetical protein